MGMKSPAVRGDAPPPGSVNWKVVQVVAVVILSYISAFMPPLKQTPLRAPQLPAPGALMVALPSGPAVWSEAPSTIEFPNVETDCTFFGPLKLKLGCSNPLVPAELSPPRLLDVVSDPSLLDVVSDPPLLDVVSDSSLLDVGVFDVSDVSSEPAGDVLFVKSAGGSVSVPLRLPEPPSAPLPSPPLLSVLASVVSRSWRPGPEDEAPVSPVLREDSSPFGFCLLTHAAETDRANTRM